MHLRLNLFPFPFFSHVGSVYFVIEVADVANDCAGLHGVQHVAIANVYIAGGSYDHIHFAKQKFVYGICTARVLSINVRRNYFKSIHASLHCTDWIDLYDLHYHAFLAQTLGRPLTYITISNHQCVFSRQQHVCAALNAIVKAMTTTILIVIFRFRYGVINIYCGNF